MPLLTDFNVSPYYNDYDSNKNYNKILFKPANIVSGRELNQLQNILQDQIEKFGETILERGSIVSGGNFYDIHSIPYIKIKDKNELSQPIVIENYIGKKLVGKNTGVEAYVVTTLSGFESKSPDLNTLYLKYTKSGIDANDKNIKTFLAGETLEVYSDSDERLEDYDIKIVSYSVDQYPIGEGHAVKCGDGILFQKGYFIRFSDQIVVVSKYLPKADGVSVGFSTEEYIIDHNIDTSLKDNATDSKNYNAPGADRIKLEPKLIVVPTKDIGEYVDFLGIQEYENGIVKSRHTGTTFNKSIYSMLEKRTFEESGNYNVNGHDVELLKMNDSGYIKINAGLSYVNGKRIRTNSPVFLKIDDSQYTTPIAENTYSDIGQYFVATTVKGFFDTNTISIANFYDSFQTSVSTPTGNSIGNIRVTSYTKNSDGTYNVYYSIMNFVAGKNLSNVKSIRYTTNGYANLKIVSNKPVVKNTNKINIIEIPHNVDSVSNVNIILNKNESSTTSNGIVTITTSNKFPYTDGIYTNYDVLKNFIVTKGNINANVSSVTISNNSTKALVNVNTSITGSNTCQSYYKIKYENAPITTKDLKTIYVRITANSFVNNIAYLGVCDALSLNKIYLGANTTFVENSPNIKDVTNMFSLEKNDGYFSYNTSYIKKNPSLSLNVNDVLLVKFKVFKINTIGVVTTVNSYPIDDTSPTLPNGYIRSHMLSKMLNNIDCRYYTANTIVYAENIANANTINSSNFRSSTPVIFDSQYSLVPSTNEYVSYTANVKSARNDSVIITQSGDFQIITNTNGESDYKKYEQNNTKSMLLATLYVPSIPIKIPKEIQKDGYNNYNNCVILENVENKSYKMSNIRNIDDRISNIEYYTMLNALELTANNMVIKDSNGLNRYKNGIFVDSFEDMKSCHVTHDDFSASWNNTEILPKFKSYNIDMKVKNSSNNIIQNDGVYRIYHKDNLFISQPFATKYRNCVNDFYNFEGKGKIKPAYDYGYDETIAPDINIGVGFDDIFVEYTDMLNEFLPITTDVTTTNTFSNTISSNTSIDVSVAGRTTTTTATVITNTEITTINTRRVTDLSQDNVSITTQRVGDFMTDIRFSPYVRPRRLRVVFTGLKPNTRFWPWFDGVSVEGYCVPASLSGTNINNMQISGDFGGELRSNNQGKLHIIFDIPENTFYVGERFFEVYDVDSKTSFDSATSHAKVAYNSMNYSISSSAIELTTRTPTFVVVDDTTVTTNTVYVSNTTTSVVRVTTEGRGDPIAQSFKIKDLYKDSDYVLLSKISIPFKTKSIDKGITLEVRKTTNGYPSGVILPFSSIRKEPSEISTSDDASVYTDFIFDTPVVVLKNEEYCFTLTPDGNSPDYNVFVAKTGEMNIVDGRMITSDVNYGMIFTSTNKTDWVSYQNENMAFKIYDCSFINNYGFLDITHDDYEFFDVLGMKSKLSVGENVFKLNEYDNGKISINSGSQSLVGISTRFTELFKEGDGIALYDQTNDNYFVTKIETIIDDSNVTLEESPNKNFDNSNYFKTIFGVCDYVSKRTTPNRVFVKKSNSDKTMYFESGDVLVGEKTNSKVQIDKVLYLPVSKLQMNVYKTEYEQLNSSLYITTQTNADGNLLNTNYPLKFDMINNLNNVNTIIKSRSLEQTENDGVSSFIVKNTFTNPISKGSYNTTPIFDIGISGFNIKEFYINELTNDVIDSEKYDSGESYSKYISKMVELSEGFDAVDLKIWLTGYRPPNTNITVYAKLISSIDNRKIDDIPWTKLVNKDNTNHTSSSSNIYDYKEYQYDLPTSNTGGAYYTENNGFVYTNEEGGVFNNYKKYMIKILFNSSGQHRIPKMKDVRAISLT